MGKLIVIEGLDASGKETQTGLLFEHLQKAGVQTKKVCFPDYESESSALVKMYLSGEFGSDPSAVNAYAASSFYAVDRYASYKMHWEDFYTGGGLVLADRYTTSNMIHQGCKIADLHKRKAYLDWLKEWGRNERYSRTQPRLSGRNLPDCAGSGTAAGMDENSVQRW